METRRVGLLLCPDSVGRFVQVQLSVTLWFYFEFLVFTSPEVTFHPVCESEWPRGHSGVRFWFLDLCCVLLWVGVSLGDPRDPAQGSTDMPWSQHDSVLQETSAVCVYSLPLPAEPILFQKCSNLCSYSSLTQIQSRYLQTQHCILTVCINSWVRLVFHPLSLFYLQQIGTSFFYSFIELV